MKLLYTAIIIFTTSLVSAQIPTKGLVSRYDFSGNAKDSSGNGHNGTVYNATLTTDRFGKNNSAYDFNGSSAYIDITTTNLLTNNYSYSLWVNPDVIPGSGQYTFPIAVGNISGGTNISLVNNSSGMIGWSAGVHNKGGSPLFSLNAIGRLPMVNEWVHLTCVRSDSFLNIYVDGKLNQHIQKYIGYDNSTGGAKPEYGSKKEAWIGGRDKQATDYFDGKIDDIRLYNRALSDCEVMNLYLENHPCRRSIIDTTYTSIAVTDTLIINANLTGVSAPNNIAQVLVYPNPTSDKVTIDIKDYAKMNGYSMKIRDVLSKEVWKSDITKQSYTIDLNTFGGFGTYFITIYDGSNSMVDVRKIILK